MKLGHNLIGIILFILILTGCTNNQTNNPSENIELDLEELNKEHIPEKVIVYFFWGDGCPHCTVQKPFIESLKEKYPSIEVKMFETWKDPVNAKLFQEIAERYDTNARGVPSTFIGDKFWVGFRENMKDEMEEKIKYCLENKCADLGQNI